ncbi:MAG: hypothetical protein Q9159_001394 [Coniocarpon cinnabarinum]
MAAQEYEKLTVLKLREVFKERGIAATGLTKKQQLIDKLREVDAESAPAGEDAEDEPPQDSRTAEDDAPGEEPAAAESVQAVEPVEPLQPEEPEAPEASGAPEPSEEPELPQAPPVEEEQKQAQLTSEKPDSAPAQPALQPSETRSPSPKAAEDDSRKRKRRSLTPPVDEDEVAQKRQKQEEETTPTQEAAMAEVEPLADANAEEAANKAAAVEAKKSLPEQQEKAAEVELAAEESAEQALSNDSKPLTGDTSQDARFRNLSTTLDRDASVPEGADQGDTGDRDVEPSRHVATAAIYIRNLKRPIREGQLRDHLKILAAPSSATAEDIEDLGVQVYLDSLRTHAFALLPSISHATRIRLKLHDVVWPKERERDALFVDFIGEKQYDDFVREEEAAVNAPAGRGGSMKRFEVAYIPDAEGNKRAELREQSGAGAGVPGAPTGPRQASTANNEPLAGRKPRPLAEAPPDTPSFGALGKMFKSTEAKPKLYFQPVPQKLADDRLEELKSQTSARLMGDEVGGGSGLPDSRRYTFEEKSWMEGRHITDDGKGVNAYEGSRRLCDNGPEFGLKVPTEFRRNRGGGFRGGRGRLR